VNEDGWNLELEKVVPRWAGGGFVFGAFADEDRPQQHITAVEPGKKLRIGRGPDCEVRVPVVMVNRLHCEVWRDESGVWVRDVQSRNGTWLRGQRLLANVPAPLRLDDVIQLSEFAVVLTARFAASLSWRDFENGLVAHLARGIAGERRIEDLPVLADALEDAGCALPELLTHLREPHQREHRCWVVKRLLRGLASGAA
jgi:hypothetical protein